MCLRLRPFHHHLMIRFGCTASHLHVVPFLGSTLKQNFSGAFLRSKAVLRCSRVRSHGAHSRCFTVLLYYLYKYLTRCTSPHFILTGQKKVKISRFQTLTGGEVRYACKSAYRLQLYELPREATQESAPLDAHPLLVVRLLYLCVVCVWFFLHQERHVATKPAL